MSETKKKKLTKARRVELLETIVALIQEGLVVSDKKPLRQILDEGRADAERRNDKLSMELIDAMLELKGW